MKISPQIWAALRDSVLNDKQELFERLVDAIADQAVRDERAHQAAAERARNGDQVPFLYSAR